MSKVSPLVRQISLAVSVSLLLLGLVYCHKSSTVTPAVRTGAFLLATGAIGLAMSMY